MPGHGDDWLTHSGREQRTVLRRSSDSLHHTPSPSSSESDTMKTATGSLLVRNGTLIDGTGRPPIADAVVHSRDGRITYAGPRLGAPALPPDTPAIDARGGTIPTHALVWRLFIPLRRILRENVTLLVHPHRHFLRNAISDNTLPALFSSDPRAGGESIQLMEPRRSNPTLLLHSSVGSYSYTTLYTLSRGGDERVVSRMSHIALTEAKYDFSFSSGTSR